MGEMLLAACILAFLCLTCTELLDVLQWKPLVGGPVNVFISNNLQAKLYLSIIDDVIENTRELFVDEGLEDQVLDDLRHLWESKLMQSKVMDDFRKSSINSSNFVLQLPANYQQTEPELSASIPASQSNGLPTKNNSEALATFSLPAALAYPVQIPAGVTLQTASGQLYKVNVPVVVTQAPASRPTQREAPAPRPPPGPSNPRLHQETEPASFVAQTHTSLPVIPESDLPHPTYESEITLGEDEASPAQEPVNASPLTQLLNFQISTERALKETAPGRDIDEILKEVIEEESEKARKLSAGNTDNQPAADLGLDLDYAYNQLSELVQLDGPPDSPEEDEEIPQDENDFLGLINAEAIKALQEENISNDSNSISSSDEDPVELTNVEEEVDPLNSGDDVVEQDIPDLFDTENVIVCQYDKIHRSKNRWKFHLKDGVMSYGGKDHVFSKAVGEAEW